MFEASRASRRFTKTSHKALLAAGVLAAGLTGVGSLAATPAAHADVIGPITFDSQSDFDNNFTIVAAQDANRFNVDSNRENLAVSDGKPSGTDGAYAVVQQSGGSTTFSASQISVGVDVGNGGRNPSFHRRYGPTLFGAQDRSATLQAGASADGSQLSIGIEPVTPGTPGQADGFNSVASSPIVGGSGDVSGRVVFTADNIDRVNNTADLTAQYFDGSAPMMAAATVTVPDYDLAANGLSTVGEVGLSRTGGRNKRADFDNYRVEFTPAAPVPEPASLALLGLGAMALLGRRRPS